MTDTPCTLETGRWFDPVTQEWVYQVFCYTATHTGQTCPGEHEQFRRPSQGNTP